MGGSTLPGPMTALARAKAVQAKVASDTNVWLKLDLLEDLINQIEKLQRRVVRLEKGNTADDCRADESRAKDARPNRKTDH